MGILSFQLLDHELVVAEFFFSDVPIVFYQAYFEFVYMLLIEFYVDFLLLVQLKIFCGLDFELLGTGKLKGLKLNLSLL